MVRSIHDKAFGSNCGRIGTAFKTDEEGHIVTKSVTGVSSAVVSNIAVLFAVSYVDSAEALEKGASKSTQFAMTPSSAFTLLRPSLGRQRESWAYLGRAVFSRYYARPDFRGELGWHPLSS